MPKRQRFSDFLWQKRLLHSGDAGQAYVFSSYEAYWNRYRLLYLPEKAALGPQAPAWKLSEPAFSSKATMPKAPESKETGNTFAAF